MRFDVGEKLSLTLFLILLAIALPWYGNGILFLLLILVGLLFKPYRAVSRVSRRRFAVLARYFVLVVLLMTVLNGLLMRGGAEWPLPGGFALSFEGVEFGLQAGMRLLVIATSILLFFASTPIPRFAQYLQSVGWPIQLVMTLLLTLYFLDTLPERVSMIFTAQEARGAPVRDHALARIKAFFLVLSPLFLSGIVESIDRGMALELRGFHSGAKITFGGESLTPRDSTVSSVFLLLSLLCLLWIIAQWLLR